MDDDVDVWGSMWWEAPVLIDNEKACEASAISDAIANSFILWA